MTRQFHGGVQPFEYAHPASRIIKESTVLNIELDQIRQGVRFARGRPVAGTGNRHRNRLAQAGQHTGDRQQQQDKGGESENNWKWKNDEQRLAHHISRSGFSANCLANDNDVDAARK
jgi:hypothetical protein